jgi:hypothetical protein
MSGQEARWQPGNPFAEQGTHEGRVAAEYRRALKDLARHFVYDVQELKATDIEKAVASARRDPRIRALEPKHQGLETLANLVKGMMEHETANLHHLDAWQAAIRRRAEDEGRLPETFTREEVARMYDGFIFRQTMERSEDRALDHYSRLLDTKQDSIVELSSNISLDRTDIKVLALDLKVRRAERIPDDKERKAVLQALDRELVGIINEVDPEQTGKRLELEELYLLRRLIHASDTGHLASVDHGTPREDLRDDLDSSDVSVDLAVTAAGDRYSFQIKTLRHGVSRATRAKQTLIMGQAERKMEGKSTHAVRLETEAIEAAYEAARRQDGKKVATSRVDKFSALEPLAGQMASTKRHKLLTLLGLTENDFDEEDRLFRQKEAARREQEAEIFAKKEADERRQRETDERLAAERLASEPTMSRNEERRQKKAELIAEEEGKRRREREVTETRRLALEKAEAERQAAIRRAELDAFDALHAERRKFEAEIAAKKEAEERMIREAEARRSAQEEERRIQAEAENAARAEREKTEAEEIRLRHEREALAEREKQAAIQARLDAAAAREAEKRQKEAKEAEERAEAEKKATVLAKARATREKNKAEKPPPPDWPPILTPGILVGLDILPEEDKRDARKILAAKNAFKAKYVEKNLGGSEVTKKEKPNTAFKTEFRTRDEWETRIGKKRAA